MKNNMIIVMMSLAFLVITQIQAEQPTIMKSNISGDDVYGIGLNGAIKFENNTIKRKMPTTENGIFNIKHQNIFYDNDLRKNVAFSGMHSTLINLLNINANFGIKAFYWKPNKRPDGFLSFKTEGLGLYKFSGSFGLWKFDIIDVDYEGPLRKTEHQKGMFTIGDSKSEGIEKYTYGVKLDPIAKRLFPVESGMIGFVLRRIFSIKFTYTNELFYGNAKCENDFYYVPQNTSFNSSSSDNYLDSSIKCNN